MKRLLWILAFAASTVFAAPQPAPPKPPYPTVLSVTQGLVSRSLTVPNAQCAHYLDTPNASGLQRITLTQSDGYGGFKPCVANGSYLQLSQTDGPIYPQWIYPPPPCTLPKPPVATQPGACPPGTESHWTQTHDWTCDNGAWVATPWTPVAPPLNSSCTPASGFQWQAPFDVHDTPVPARPAKNGTYLSPYGTTIQRVTDFAAETSAQWEVSWYNRFQAVNSDGSLIVFYESDGFWNLYDARTNAFLKKLNGPGGDAEFNWDATRPNLAYYVPTNGGTSVRQIDVAANTNTLYYDFTAAVHALWPDVNHCWTKSEGRTSADGRYIAFQCERDPGGGGNWITRGFVKIDLVAKAVIFSSTNTTSSRPDNSTISPNGLWLITSYSTPIGTNALATDGSGRTCHLHDTVEHAALGKLTNGHDAILLPDYTSGTLKAMDIDACARLDTSWPTPISIYNNPWLFNPPSTCHSCAMHPSFNAYHKPGWALVGFYGPYAASITPPANVIALNVETGRYYGVAASYAADLDYWDEAHCSTDIDFTFAWCTENWLHSPMRDIVKITIPTLPQ